MTKWIKFFIFGIFGISNICAQEGNFASEEVVRLVDTLFIRKPLTPLEKTDSIITVFKNDPVLKNAQWGFCVYNPKTKKVIASKDEQQAYIPASTTKLITTESALSMIGENFKWRTQLDYSGEIDSLGRLNGNLYLVGNNDPTLGNSRLGAISKFAFFAEMFQELEDNGIKEVNGNIVSESVVFKTDFNALSKEIIKFDKGNYYSVPSKTALEQNELFDLNSTIAENSKIGILESEQKFSISKEINAKKEVESSINLPPAPTFLAKEFKNYLIKNKKMKVGSVIPQNYSTLNTATVRKQIYILESPPLKDVVHFTNQTSSNHFAEELLKSVGYFVGKNGNRITGINNVMVHLDKEKFDTNGLNYADGSGLSRANYVTPISQVKYLASIMKKPIFNTFFESLPKAGETGTLKKMFVNSNAIGKLRAKTGTLSNVKALTGYVDTKSGDRLCFSLLVNNFSGNIALVKKRMEILMESVVNY